MRGYWRWVAAGAAVLTLIALAAVVQRVYTGASTEAVSQDSTVSGLPEAPAEAAAGSDSPVAVIAGPSGDTVVGNDPVSGRNEGIDFGWEEFCLSARYQVQIAKDPLFRLIVFDSGDYAPASSLAPALGYPAGGALEAGHTYYWRVRVRQAATGQTILSPWSYPESFTVKVGLPAAAPSPGLQLLFPYNGCGGCPAGPVSFSWSPFKDSTRYRLVLAKDSELSQVVADEVVTSTAYEYPGVLDYGASYFWRVMALEPSPGDWSATFSFHTEPRPAPALPPAPAEPPPAPDWARAVIAIGAILILAALVLIFQTGRA